MISVILIFELTKVVDRRYHSEPAEKRETRMARKARNSYVVK